MAKKELWVQNSGTMDVSLSDLGVKVPVGKTVNIFAVNPYLTEEKVQASLDSGALAKRLGNNRLKLVEKSTNTKPAVLDRIKQSTEPLQVKKTKSSVVVESGNPELNEEGDKEGFSFADYGIGDVGEDVSQVKKGASVVVEAKKDEVEDETSDTVLEPKVKNNISNQSVVTMEKMSQNSSHPAGKFADMSVGPAQGKPFVVTPPPSTEDESKTEAPASPKMEPVLDETTGVVTTNMGVTAAARDLELQAEINQLAENMDTTPDKLPESLIESLKAERAIKSEPTKFDSKVATKTAEGATVMKIKEVEKEEDQ